MFKHTVNSAAIGGALVALSALIAAIGHAFVDGFSIQNEGTIALAGVALLNALFPSVASAVKGFLPKAKEQELPPPPMPS